MIHPALTLIKTNRLLIVAFVLGAVILAFELAAARIIAPYLGDTIYTWTSIIGVILASLAAGYTLGGNWADRRHRKEDIVLLLMAAALAIAVVSVVKDGLLLLIGSGEGPLQLQAFLASLILFSPPTILLGAVAPYLARMNITDIKTSGRRLASINAAETIGSLTGTFATGYVLFGLVGSHLLILLLAILLIAVSFLLDYKKFLLPRMILIGIIGLLCVFPARVQLSGTIADLDSAYARIIVRDTSRAERTVRVLQTDNRAFQSGAYTNGDKTLAFAYTRAFAYAAELKPDATKNLIIGGGAFTFPEYLADRNPGVRIDTIEIDDRLVTVSEQHFNFSKPANLRIIAADGRHYLNKNAKKYDAIYVDAFSSLVPPFQLTTSQAIERMRTSLEKDGLIIANIVAPGTGDDGGFLQHMASTFQHEFGYVSVYRVVPDIPVDSPQNLLLLASEVPFEENVQEIASRHPEFKVMTKAKVAVNFDDDKILTDDYAPVEQLILN